jgi:putative sterol carrier protein
MPEPKIDFETNIPKRIGKNPDAAKKVGAIYLFKVTGDNGGTWTIDLKENPGVKEGDQGNAECTIELTSEDWMSMTADPGSAMQLFMNGKLKVSGNMMLATKLQSILR